jgi:hypothetical protein
MGLLRAVELLALVEHELALHADLYADLMAVLQFEPQTLWPWMKVLDQAEAKLGDLPSVARWLVAPHDALNGAPPATLIGVDDGIVRAQALLAQLD